MGSDATFDIRVPLGPLPALRAAAEEEQREPADLVRDALERYMADREWNKILAYGERRAKALGLSEADVPRLIAEARQEK